MNRLWLVLAGFILMLVNSALAQEAYRQLYCEYRLLPSASFRSISSNLILAYPITDRTGISLDYLSFDNPILAGASYTITYRLTYGLAKIGRLTPTVIGGYRFIYTPETGFVTPIDLGVNLELALNEQLTCELPVVVSLFAKDSLLDTSFNFRLTGWPFGEVVLGARDLKPVGASAFVERLLLLLGISNSF